MLNDFLIVTVIGLIILVMVLIYMGMSQRRLKANVQRIKEEFGQPGEREMTAAAGIEPPPAARWDGEGEDSTRMIDELDARIERASRLIATADEQIRRLESAIARAEHSSGPAPPQPPPT